MFKITPSYSFWEHPIRWIKERKTRNLMGKIIEYQWNNGMKEKVEKASMDMIMYGKTDVNFK